MEIIRVQLFRGLDDEAFGPARTLHPTAQSTHATAPHIYSVSSSQRNPYLSAVIEAVGVALSFVVLL